MNDYFVLRKYKTYEEVHMSRLGKTAEVFMLYSMYLCKHYTTRGSFRCVLVNELNCDIVVSKFEF